MEVSCDNKTYTDLSIFMIQHMLQIESWDFLEKWYNILPQHFPAHLGFFVVNLLFLPSWNCKTFQVNKWSHL